MFTLDRYASTPIYTQLIDQIELHILDGSLRPQDPLPSVRTLSVSLGINPNTLQKAYAALERGGICRSVPGSGRFVAEDARERIASGRRARLGALGDIVRELAVARIPLREIQACAEEAYQGAAQGWQEEGKT